ncbi:MAG: type I DNA topoisomerase [Victivallales bacterium]|nr:type I DNA topoisomerase [Victivallales bacterium]
MSKTLVVVESPAKARTIGRFLGNEIQVQASMGHVRDLPQHSLGVDIEHDFEPQYELTTNGKKVVKSLRQAAASADQIYLATDPDREGEAIAWHLQEILRTAGHGQFHRITFHEITRNAIERSFKEPGQIAMDLVAAQQARRVLDRLVGYQVSPLLWRSIKKGTSAGRVQSVALRLVVEREREIQAFKPEEYWNLDALFTCPDLNDTQVRTRLFRLNNEKAVVANARQAEVLADALESAGVTHRVTKVTETPRRQAAPPPFITSTLQQACGSALKLGASQTMRIAQELYEGIELGNGSVGLITYMRTDSVNVAKEAQAQAREYIAANYGEEYVPERPNIYRSRKSAQEAHEAIRPTDVTRTPDAVSAYLTGPQLRVYRIIWNRFMASQMSAARQIDHAVEIESRGGDLSSLVFPPDDKKNAMKGIICTFRASARETVFPGYLKVYNIKEVGEEDNPDDTAHPLPHLKEGMICNLKDLIKEQCFTTPPSRYSEASLVKALELNGVGRPSTFATTVNMIQEREYVTKDKSSLTPTQLGFQVNDFLVEQMPDLFDIGFTSQMEEELDQVEEGELNWVEMLKDFYEKFQKWLGARKSASFRLTADDAAELLKLFKADFEFDAPVLRGGKKYDDAKFKESLEAQLEKGKDLTERQSNALLNMCARYVNRLPAVQKWLDEKGYGDLVTSLAKEAEEEAAQPPTEVSPALQKLFDAMSSLEWEPPVRRGSRTYDDGKFFKSLKKQAEQGKMLSDSQMAALLKIASRYAAKIDGYTDLVTALGATIAPTMASTGEATVGMVEDKSATKAKIAVAPPSAEAIAKIERLFDMMNEIEEWRQPTPHSGRRAFDDKEFAMSLQKQYQQKGNLSDRQLSALKRMLQKYENQIPDFKSRAKAAGIGEAAPPPEVLEERCPECGAPLVKRMGRGRPFIGCSAFPKCRYIKPRNKE